jgi:uncharacterized protein YqiB (DUF1249 family)
MPYMNRLERLELVYEREMDRLDRLFMNSAMTQEEYDAEVRQLERDYRDDCAECRNYNRY